MITILTLGYYDMGFNLAVTEVCKWIVEVERPSCASTTRK